MQFPPAKDKREPGGFSGSGAWYQTATQKRKIWRPEMILAGIITHYHRSRQALEICRIERVVKFFSKNIRGILVVAVDIEPILFPITKTH
jgi:hypothetical protein